MPHLKRLDGDKTKILHALVERPDYGIQVPWPTASRIMDLSMGHLEPDEIKIIFIPFVIALEKKRSLHDFRFPQFLRYLWYADLIIYQFENINSFEGARRLLEYGIKSFSYFDRSRLILVDQSWQNAYSWQGEINLLPLPGMLKLSWLIEKVYRGRQIRCFQACREDVINSIRIREVLSYNASRT